MMVSMVIRYISADAGERKLRMARHCRRYSQVRKRFGRTGKGNPAFQGAGKDRGTLADTVNRIGFAEVEAQLLGDEPFPGRMK